MPSPREQHNCTKLKDGWVTLAKNVANDSANVFGNDSRFGLMAGVHHKF